MDIPSIQPSLAKIDRANQNILNLDQLFSKFIDSPPYSFISQPDPNPKVRAFTITKVEDVGLPLRVLVGEIAHHLRSAFDLLVYQLMLRASVSDEKRLSRCAFPVVNHYIHAERKEYEETLRRKIEGIDPRAVTRIENLQPWKSNGMGSFLAQIDWLDNTDKHRLLLTVVNSVRVGGFNFRDADGNITVTPHKAIVPLEAGAIVKLELLQPEMNVDLKQFIRLQIAFGEPGILRGKPVVPQLQELSDFTRATIELFERYF